MTFHTARLAGLVAAAVALMTASAAAQARSGGAPAPRFDWTATDPSSGSVVAGAPFSADAATTVTQTLGDGTRIEQQTTAKFYRDSTGRFRREQTLLGLDSLAPGGGTQTIITIETTPGDPMPWILDPNARVAARAPRLLSIYNPSARIRYVGPDGLMVDRDQLTVRRYQLPEAAREQVGSILNPNHPDAMARARELERAANQLSRNGMPAIAQPGLPPGIEATEELLAPREMEGVRVTGRRTTAVIPIGRIGNDQPIRITDERWESPELRVLVYSRFSDPRTGVIEYRLTNIRRTEPAADLFVVPSDYTIREGQPGFRVGGAGRGARGN